MEANGIPFFFPHPSFFPSICIISPPSLHPSSLVLLSSLPSASSSSPQSSCLFSSGPSSASLVVQQPSQTTWRQCTDPNTTPFSAPLGLSRACSCHWCRLAICWSQLHHTARTDRLGQGEILRAVFWNTAPLCLANWSCHHLLTMAGR